MPRLQVQLDEVLDALHFGLLSNVHKIMPGLVVAYTPAVKGKSPALVDVQPAVNDVRFDTELGTRISEPWPVLMQVPLGMPRGGGAAMAWPMKKNDGVTLLGWDLDPTAFRSSGRQADPLDTRRHGGSYWLALPIDITDAGAFADPGSDLVITEPVGGLILVGKAASDFVALATQTNANLQKLQVAYDAHVHLAAGPTSPTNPPTAGPHDPVGALPSVAATVLKAK